ncbi:MAG TPA: hypothetical protein PLI68_08275, partial [Bacteroidia bacterium]|nr:hypothetical protein [Bacteroidia bacterium]
MKKLIIKQSNNSLTWASSKFSESKILYFLIIFSSLLFQNFTSYSQSSTGNQSFAACATTTSNYTP